MAKIIITRSSLLWSPNNAYCVVIDMKQEISESLNASKQALDDFISNDENIEAIAEAAKLMIATLQNGNAIYSCGNGGSMSDAMHFAEELTGRYRENRRGLAATAISDPGHISCVANDFGYEFIFSRYLEARANSGDLLLAISTSGSSANVLRAAKYAQENDMSVVSLTGKANSQLSNLSTVDISTVDSAYADKAQELHIKVIHILIEQIERSFFPENYSS
jgi:D-sedoheptulose 7-phosphate isomerase